MNKKFKEKSYWWYDKYSVNNDDYKKETDNKSWWSSSYKNSTKGWMDKVGGHDWGFGWLTNKKDKKKNFVYQKLLNQLQTSINVIDSDKDLRVRWSDGEKINTPESDCVYLSPNDTIVKVDGKDQIDDQMLDILTGKVYLAKVLKNQITKEDYEYSQKLKSMGTSKKMSPHVVKIWQALETHIAKKFLEDNWQGFMPHVIKEIEHSSSSKNEIQNYIESTKNNPNLEAITLGIAWNLVHEHNPVKIPDVYDKCLDAAAEILEREETEKNKIQSCYSIVSKLKEIIKEIECKNNQTSGGEDNKEDNKESCTEKAKEAEPDSKQPDSKHGENKEDKEDKKEDNKESCVKKINLDDYKICDDDLFGEAVKNNVDFNLGKQAPDSEFLSSGASVECNKTDINGLQNEFVLAEIKEGNKTYYDDFVNELKDIINSIKNNFYFVNNESYLNSYGHISGDIDENNLYKLKLNDDHLMSKKDILSQRKIAVCLLVDESGSMDDKYLEAIRATITLFEGLKSYFQISVYGHTAETDRYQRQLVRDYGENYLSGCLITEYQTPRNKKIESCVNISAKAENIDGLAIELVAKKFYQDYPNYRKILFHISDGEPSSSCYGGPSAENHVNSVCRLMKSKLDIEVYGIGICEAFTNATGTRLYGQNNFVVLEDTMSSVGVITRFLKQVCNKNLKTYS